MLGGGILVSSAAALLTPGAARVHLALLIALRVASGLGEAAMLPAVNALVARWSSPTHSSVAVCVLYAGSDAGVIVGMVVTGVLCEYVGWPSAFYLFGTVGCVWCVVWVFLGHDSPPRHPLTSAAERSYWERRTVDDDPSSCPTTPWTDIVTSVAVWALAAASFALCWGYFTLCLLYTSPSPRDRQKSRMPSSA